MDYINAFWVGGLICALVQILMEKTKMMPGRIMVLLVVTGAVISAHWAGMNRFRLCGSRSQCTVIGLWKCINEGRERSGAGTGIFRTFCRRIQGWSRGNLRSADPRLSGEPAQQTEDEGVTVRNRSYE